nr:OpgC domain-containing protein [Paracoccus saliphilus]
MRIIGLDAARSLAIVLAMSSHVYVEAGLHPHIPDQLSQILRFAFQIATPTFILLFGTMLEVIYQPRWTTAPARRQVAARLVSRALQCWVLYAISILALFVTNDQYSLRFSIGTMLFMGNSPYTEILKFYAVVLALAPVLLWLRARLGLWPLVVAALAYHAAWPLLTALPDAHHDLGAPIHIGRLVMFTTGFGDLQLAGPSILHGLTLVVAGQLLGRYLLGGSAQGLHTVDPGTDQGFQRRVSALFAGAVLAAMTGALALPDGAFAKLADGSFRMDSHGLYFAAGVVSATLMTIMFVWLIDIKQAGSTAAWTRLTFFGRTSMFTFAWGNILLYLVDVTPAGAAASLFWAILLLLAVCVMSYGFDLAARRSQTVVTGLSILKRPVDRMAQSLLNLPRRFQNAR